MSVVAVRRVLGPFAKAKIAPLVIGLELYWLEDSTFMGTITKRLIFG
jgi:hypothetical protein